MINRLLAKLEEIEDNVSKCGNDARTIESRINLLKQEFDNIPSGKDIFPAVYELRDADFKYKKVCEDQDKKIIDISAEIQNVLKIAECKEY